MGLNRQTAGKPRGFVTVYMVLAMLTLIPMAGLAIDFTVLYNVKCKLQAAVDAAALGSGTMLQSSTTLDAPTIAIIKDAAQRFFNANYPSSYWGSSQVYYDSVPSENGSKLRSIWVHAEYNVPMLFMRVVGISRSTVAAQATVNIRYLAMMIVVDRSGSVLRAGANAVIQNALNNFVAYTPTTTPTGQSIFVDGRDMIGMGSFGGTWNADFAPTTTFRSGVPNIATAISNIPFGNNATNTSEGLYRAYQQLLTLNQTGALNVIVLLTDGRPSAFTATFNQQGSCTSKGNQLAFMTATVAQTWPPLPPTTQGGQQGVDVNNNPVYVWTLGLFNPVYTGLYGGAPGTDGNPIAASGGCHYAADQTTVTSDVATFPATDAYNNSTTGPVYTGEGQNVSDPRAVRYASFNAADNQATTIRNDTTIRPVLFVIGLNEPPSGGEPLDADWLARVANDPNYKDVNGNSVFQKTQTSGMYFNVNAAGLQGAFTQISSEILRLSQ